MPADAGKPREVPVKPIGRGEVIRTLDPLHPMQAWTEHDYIHHSS
jgi:hypothetical protein